MEALDTLQHYLLVVSNSKNALMSLVGLEYRLHCILNDLTSDRCIWNTCIWIADKSMNCAIFGYNVPRIQRTIFSGP